jgi:hypothetical protein
MLVITKKKIFFILKIIINLLIMNLILEQYKLELNIVFSQSKK